MWDFEIYALQERGIFGIKVLMGLNELKELGWDLIWDRCEGFVGRIVGLD
ncbi:hypothetical protein HYC85_003912 [Camellia sinensis]|uniref:Uncharacterized protein n=1 Tax=Camellia sinensis TaxID=4442 RepID=A0A7J7HW89_CAMSI|nr:hypothetical protein HYC85_003912 [Camellia sinensis]